MRAFELTCCTKQTQYRVIRPEHLDFSINTPAALSLLAPFLSHINNRLLQNELSLHRTIAHNTFHPFPRLPLELRTQIWEAACLRSQSFQAIHYVTFNGSTTQMAPLSHNWDDSKPKNKSVYLSSAGLWTACRESKEVVTKDWVKQPRPENDWDIYICCPGEEANYYFDHGWPEEEYMPKAFMFYSGVDGEHWRQSVYPEQDLFCLVPDDWELVARNWETCVCFIIAVEFDPSWNLCLENKTESHFIEDVPASLEFLLKLLFSHVRHNLRQVIKLIVREVDWIFLHSTTVSQIRDSDEEYVELSAHDVEPCNADRRGIQILRDTALGDFFEYLDEVYYDRLLEIYCDENMMSTGDYERRGLSRFHIRDHFSILLSRANQVEN
ncbi:unnamed protein product [Fusarium venenatum]|uniref:2EXR domain-containing protein n=1 Tax=Fusarium venenatum TaxID=56646 RepID=A0A2L2TJQ8_9HYPO|nr:uncharacterized protein FVRRES_10336 [Fusarium venenatum]CEI70259.1 unnamed protein product [Fusarium venenatum]